MYFFIPTGIGLSRRAPAAGLFVFLVRKLFMKATSALPQPSYGPCPLTLIRNCGHRGYYTFAVVLARLLPRGFRGWNKGACGLPVGKALR
jgi:hypothetical protein